jgi:hippurate hydrolase
MKCKELFVLIVSVTSLTGHAAEGKGPSAAGLDAIYPDLDALYIDLHQNPELSGQEEKTSAKLADRLKRLGYEVTTGVGGYGVVALMRNGNGPTLLLRTDMDALPIQEKTGLPYASKVNPGEGSWHSRCDARLRPRYLHDRLDRHGNAAR